MRFLFPGFLFALLAIAIPIIIHLFNFRKYRKVYFSNVRFLKSIEQQTSSLQNFKNLLVLAARILAITFLVLAFARPYIANKAQITSANKQVVSIFVDNSYSMEGINKEGTLLDEARRRAKEIAAAYTLNDKFQLLTNDFEGKHQRLLSYDDFINAVDDVKISPAIKNLKQVLSRVSDLFSQEPGAGKIVYLISDFQKNLLNAEPAVMDSSVAIRLIRVNANPLPNISIDSVWFLSAINKPGEAGKIVARFRNNSDQKAENVPVKLLIDGQQRSIADVDIRARATQNDTLTFSGLSAGWKAAEISITDYPVVFDDRFYFSFYIRPNMKILAINGSLVNPYLQALYRSDIYFDFQNTPAGNINYSDLDNYSLLILNEIGSFSTGLIQQLKNYTERGGNLLILPSLDADGAGMKNLLGSLKTDVPLQVVSSEIKVTAINLQHPLFKGVFETIPKNIDLPSVKKFLRYTSQSKTNKKALLSLPGSDAFLSEYRLGNGHIYLSAVPLNDEAGNFQQHSIFVPIMYQISLLSSQQQRLYFILGEDQLLEIPRTVLNNNQTLALRKDNFEATPDLRQVQNVTQIYIADQIKEAGNYELFKDDSLIANLSFNQAGLESDLSYADDKNLLSQLPKDQVKIINSAEGVVKSAVQSANRGVELWKLCIVLALLSLAAEILLIRFYRTQPVIAESKNSNTVT